MLSNEKIRDVNKIRNRKENFSHNFSLGRIFGDRFKKMISTCLSASIFIGAINMPLHAIAEEATKQTREEVINNNKYGLSNEQIRYYKDEKLKEREGIVIKVGKFKNKPQGQIILVKGKTAQVTQINEKDIGKSVLVLEKDGKIAVIDTNGRQLLIMDKNDIEITHENVNDIGEGTQKITASKIIDKQEKPPFHTEEKKQVQQEQVTPTVDNKPKVILANPESVPEQESKKEQSPITINENYLPGGDQNLFVGKIQIARGEPGTPKIEAGEDIIDPQLDNRPLEVWASANENEKKGLFSFSLFVQLPEGNKKQRKEIKRKGLKKGTYGIAKIIPTENSGEENVAKIEVIKLGNKKKTQFNEDTIVIDLLKEETIDGKEYKHIIGPDGKDYLISVNNLSTKKYSGNRFSGSQTIAPKEKSGNKVRKPMIMLEHETTPGSREAELLGHDTSRVIQGVLQGDKKGAGMVYKKRITLSKKGASSLTQKQKELLINQGINLDDDSSIVGHGSSLLPSEIEAGFGGIISSENSKLGFDPTLSADFKFSPTEDWSGKISGGLFLWQGNASAFFSTGGANGNFSYFGYGDASTINSNILGLIGIEGIVVGGLTSSHTLFPALGVGPGAIFTPIIGKTSGEGKDGKEEITAIGFLQYIKILRDKMCGKSNENTQIGIITWGTKRTQNNGDAITAKNGEEYARCTNGNMQLRTLGKEDTNNLNDLIEKIRALETSGISTYFEDNFVKEFSNSSERLGSFNEYLDGIFAYSFDVFSGDLPETINKKDYSKIKESGSGFSEEERNVINDFIDKLKDNKITKDDALKDNTIRTFLLRYAFSNGTAIRNITFSTQNIGYNENTGDLTLNPSTPLPNFKAFKRNYDKQKKASEKLSWIGKALAKKYDTVITPKEGNISGYNQVLQVVDEHEKEGSGKKGQFGSASFVNKNLDGTTTGIVSDITSKLNLSSGVETKGATFHLSENLTHALSDLRPELNGKSFEELKKEGFIKIKSFFESSEKENEEDAKWYSELLKEIGLLYPHQNGISLITFVERNPWNESGHQEIEIAPGANGGSEIEIDLAYVKKQRDLIKGEKNKSSKLEKKIIKIQEEQELQDIQFESDISIKSIFEKEDKEKLDEKIKKLHELQNKLKISKNINRIGNINPVLLVNKDITLKTLREKMDEKTRERISKIEKAIQEKNLELGEYDDLFQDTVTLNYIYIVYLTSCSNIKELLNEYKASQEKIKSAEENLADNFRGKLSSSQNYNAIQEIIKSTSQHQRNATLLEKAGKRTFEEFELIKSDNNEKVYKSSEYEVTIRKSDGYIIMKSQKGGNLGEFEVFKKDGKIGKDHDRFKQKFEKVLKILESHIDYDEENVLPGAFFEIL